MFRLGIRYFGWVYSPAFYTQIGTDEIIRLSSQVKIQAFYDVVQAWEWLLEKPNHKHETL